MAATAGAVNEGVEARKEASACVLNSHQPLVAERAARIVSGIVIDGGDSWAWWPASSGTRVGPVNVMNTARKV